MVRQSRLYESAPAYVTDQPTFVNGALAALTPLQPLELLDALKTVEVRCTIIYNPVTVNILQNLLHYCSLSYHCLHVAEQCTDPQSGIKQSSPGVYLRAL